MKDKAFRSIPNELKRQEQWVCWRLYDDGKNVRKVPVNPRNGRAAMANKPKTWASFEVARDYFRAHPSSVDGIGFMFTEDDPYVGIDLDKCCVDGALTDVANEVLEKLDSYTEYSPSGRGLHVICKGELPEGKGRRTREIEMYDRGRYFTMTGNWLKETPRRVANRGPELCALLKKFFAKKKTQSKKRKKKASASKKRPGRRPYAKTSEDPYYGLIIKKLLSPHDAWLAKVLDLWRGRWEKHHESQSEADLALCVSLAYWTGGDAGSIDELFALSGLYREKWDREDYSGDTVRKAIKLVRKKYAKSDLFCVNQFLNKCCTISKGNRERLATVYRAFKEFSKTHGHRAITRRDFTSKLKGVWRITFDRTPEGEGISLSLNRAGRRLIEPGEATRRRRSTKKRKKSERPADDFENWRPATDKEYEAYLDRTYPRLNGRDGTEVQIMKQ